MPRVALADRVGLDDLLEFLRPRHRVLLLTSKSDGGPQLSPVTAGIDEVGRVLITAASRGSTPTGMTTARR